jgi:excisionase family DNA binding protein
MDEGGEVNKEGILMHEDRHFFRPDEFANRFRISLSYVYLLIQNKEINAVKIGRVWRIPKKSYCQKCQGCNGCSPCTWSRS